MKRKAEERTKSVQRASQWDRAVTGDTGLDIGIWCLRREADRPHSGHQPESSFRMRARSPKKARSSASIRAVSLPFHFLSTIPASSTSTA